MAKSQFNDAELHILQRLACSGQTKPLSNALRQNLADALVEDLNLHPLYVREVESVRRFQSTDLSRDARSLKDDHLNFFYLPIECEEVTGSNASNWQAWSAAALGYGRGTHRLAPSLSLALDSETYEEMVARGIANPESNRPVRLLSVEMVAFYILAQTRTWDFPSKIRVIKARLDRILDENLSIPVDPSTLISSEDDVNIDEFISNSTLANTRYPKKAKPALSYNPSSTGKDNSVSVVSGNRSGGIVVTEDMSLNEIQTAMASLAALARQKREEAALVTAKDFKVTDIEVDITNARPHQLTIRMGDGRSFTYNIQEQPSDVDDLLANLEY